ncbi:DRTGG domain-containing protein [Irregularibacter muris]|uniref:DRTGG domain-containing protein n=1 Tax=Irregularibacter muris TaxID=1796619 RepID=A0AAE3HFG3_9FIRM|nr:DRTGG domain-containing protein [Irregularibacter muris]MCR1899156.1 DRTGG domain-containing protein [Irregularibacter muris]
MNKHQKILHYIKELEVGAKISVRKIAQELNVSEGTAYRAIKEAENQELVSTIPRTGTIRIEKVEKKNLEQLTFGEVVNIVEGNVISGWNGLNKILNKFAIGAMTLDAMTQYLSEGDLLIVGNRAETYSLALERNCAILITGGFTCDEEIKRIANKKNLPIISSTYDSFTVATMLNKAIYERLIKKDILLVEDILVEDPFFIESHKKVRDCKKLMAETGHERFPVLDKQGVVVGMITPKDMVIPDDDHLNDDQPIHKIMTRSPITVSPNTSVAYAAHRMIWEGIEMIPVVENKILIGLITRRDVMKAIQYMQNQPQVGETMEDLLIENFQVKKEKDGVVYSGKVTPRMLSQLGIASWGSLNMLMTVVGTAALEKHRPVEMIVDNFTSHFIRPIQIDFPIDVRAIIIDLGRNFCKIEVVIQYGEQIVAKGMLAVRIVNK